MSEGTTDIFEGAVNWFFFLQQNSSNDISEIGEKDPDTEVR